MVLYEFCPDCSQDSCHAAGPGSLAISQSTMESEHRCLSGLRHCLWLKAGSLQHNMQLPNNEGGLACMMLEVIKNHLLGTHLQMSMQAAKPAIYDGI